MHRLLIAFVLLTSACQADETVTAYLTGPSVFNVVSIDGAPFAANAIIDLSEAGHIAGTAPCNQYSAEQKAVYPWFEAGMIIATRMACPDLDAESLYLTALSEMTLSEVAGDILILSNTDGREMVFQAP